MNEAARIVTKAGEAAASPHLTRAAVSARYDRELARVTAADYVDAGSFLEEFHGRELCVDLHGWLTHHGATGLRRKSLEQELAAAVVEVYREVPAPDGLDDFRDLANAVRSLAGLPPLG